MTIKALIFDFDGTLADTVPVCVQAFQNTFRHYLGRDFTYSQIIDRFGPNEEGMIRKEIPGEEWPAALEMYLREYERAHAACLSVFPGIIDLLAGLRARGVPLAVVTGKGPRSAAISSRLLGMDPFFDAIISNSSSHDANKPAGIRAQLEQWGLPASAAAYIGDAPSDIDSSRQAGVLPIAAAWAGDADREALAARQPAELFTSVEDFSRWAEQKFPI